jgi:hypothetical protein
MFSRHCIYLRSAADQLMSKHERETSEATSAHARERGKGCCRTREAASSRSGDVRCAYGATIGRSAQARPISYVAARVRATAQHDQRRHCLTEAARSGRCLSHVHVVRDQDRVDVAVPADVHTVGSTAEDPVHSGVLDAPGASHLPWLRDRQPYGSAQTFGSGPNELLQNFCITCCSLRRCSTAPKERAVALRACTVLAADAGSSGASRRPTQAPPADEAPAGRSRCEIRCVPSRRLHAGSRLAALVVADCCSAWALRQTRVCMVATPLILPRHT